MIQILIILLYVMVYMVPRYLKILKIMTIYSLCNKIYIVKHIKCKGLVPHSHVSLQTFFSNILSSTCYFVRKRKENYEIVSSHYF
jgi:hypothetical protein